MYQPMAKREALEKISNSSFTSEDFERIWKIYPKKSNKQRAYSIFKKKYKDKDIVALEIVIKMYIETKKDFLPDFDSLLNSRLDEFIEIELSKEAD